MSPKRHPKQRPKIHRKWCPNLLSANWLSFSELWCCEALKIVLMLIGIVVITALINQTYNHFDQNVLIISSSFYDYDSISDFDSYNSDVYDYKARDNYREP